MSWEEKGLGQTRGHAQTVRAPLCPPPPRVSNPSPRPLLAGICLPRHGEARGFPEAAVGVQEKAAGPAAPPTSHAPTRLTSAPALLSFAAPSSRAPSPITPPARAAHNDTSLDHILSSGLSHGRSAIPLWKNRGLNCSVPLGLLRCRSTLLFLDWETTLFSA